jgi:hypothetical protein
MLVEVGPPPSNPRIRKHIEPFSARDSRIIPDSADSRWPSRPSRASRLNHPVQWAPPLQAARGEVLREVQENQGYITKVAILLDNYLSDVAESHYYGSKEQAASSQVATLPLPAVQPCVDCQKRRHPQGLRCLQEFVVAETK